MKFWVNLMSTTVITDSSQNKIVKRKLHQVTVSMVNCKTEQNNTCGENTQFFGSNVLKYCTIIIVL